MTEIRVPTLGESVTEATIGRWFKKAGDAVAVDEPLVELETDKVTIEVPAQSAGVLGEISAQARDPAAPARCRRPRFSAEGRAGRRPAGAVGAQTVGRERHRCVDRSRLRQGRPGDKG